ncbi:hypothetical protein J3R83DRAFT_11857 [Lanmaoa asiatica]|nr:hypothetical protein J3R83DRAFT_11857 [Lanmaoa asiatica]
MNRTTPRATEKSTVSSTHHCYPLSTLTTRPPSDHVDTLPSPDASSTLPPSLLFYAARNILSPSFIIGQIPDLLNLLTAVRDSPPTHGRNLDVRLLAAGEVRALRRFLDKKDAQRRQYIMLVRSLIQLYIHYLWTAPESCLLAKRLIDFFPGSIQAVDVDKPSELLFHVDLSKDEKEYFGQLKVECREWMKLAVDWESKREETCRDEGLSREDMDETFADDFRATFPQPFEPSEMARNVDIYMNMVEDIVRKLEQWFPPSSGE